MTDRHSRRRSPSTNASSARTCPRCGSTREPRRRDKVRGQELESALSVRNLALLGRILATAALRRTESRGAHFRLDHPQTDDAHWRVVTRFEWGPAGALEFHRDPVKTPAGNPAPLSPQSPVD